MGSDSILGLLFQISADPSQAQAAIDQFERSTGAALQRTTGQFQSMGSAISPLRYSVRDLTGELDQGLLSNRESVRLLSEELGVHMPRAVSGAIAEVMPAIGGMGTALLGVFAVEEIVKFTRAMHDLDDEASGVAAAEKLMAGYIRDNNALLEEQAKQSSKVAVAQARSLQMQAAGMSAQIEALKQEISNDESWAGRLGEWIDKGLGKYKELADAEQTQKDLVAEAAKMMKIFAEDEQKETRATAKAHEDAAKQEEQALRKGQTLRNEIEMWRIKAAKQAQADVRQDLAQEMALFGVQEKGNNAELQELRSQQKAMNDLAVSEQRRNQLSLQYLQLLDEIDGVEQRQAALARSAGPGSSNTITQTNQLTDARERQITVTQELRAVEAAFTQALAGELGPLESLTQQAGDLAGEFAEMISGTKLAAEVRGAFDVALAAEHLAAFIASGGADAKELMASIQYGLAAAEMFQAAGRGGGGRSGGGGGGGSTQSRYGAGGSGGGGGSQPGSGGSGPGRGPSVVWNQYGPTVGTMNDFAKSVANVLNTLGKSGRVMLTATNANTNGAKQS